MKTYMSRVMPLNHGVIPGNAGKPETVSNDAWQIASQGNQRRN